jgi:GDP-D-mannose dehydratase
VLRRSVPAVSLVLELLIITHYLELACRRFRNSEFFCFMKPEVPNAVSSSVRVKINPCHPMPTEVDVLLGDLSEARHQLDWCHSTPSL